MAWLSSGNCNEDLVEQMVDHGVIKSSAIHDAFIFTDRGDFVQKESRAQAYHDRPYKNGFIHISAPHMYATVLEALELSSGLAFLNVGSGSGYLSCLAACLLGDSGLSHGIEVSPQAVEHSRECTQRWFDALLARRQNAEGGIPDITPEGVSIVCGNCFNIDVDRVVSSCRYDRIYIGAGCPESRKEFFFSLLADDGIMVASINEKNELIKIRRTHRHVYAETHISQVIFAPLVEPDPSDEVYEMRPAPRERLNSFASAGGSIASSGVTSEDSFSSFGLSSSPVPVITFSSTPGAASTLMTLMSLPHRSKKKVVLPPLLWSPTPSRHRQFSRCFKAAVFQILLISRHPRHQSATRKMNGLTVVTSKLCPCSRIPHTLWMLILMYTTRDWFVPAPSPAQLIHDELVVEKTLRQAAEQRALEEERKRLQAERERDAYKLMVRRMSREQNLFLPAADISMIHDEWEEEDNEEEEEEEDLDEEEVEEEEEEEEENFSDDEGTDDMMAEDDELAGFDVDEEAEEEEEDEVDDEGVGDHAAFSSGVATWTTSL